MLNGKELGAAIKTAIQLKIDTGAIRSKADVAAHFGVKTPSIYDWIKKGSISKDKLPELWRYFSDVVTPSHWGLSQDQAIPGLSAPEGKTKEPASSSYLPPLSPEELALLDAWRTGDDMTKAMLRTIIDANLKKRQSAA